MATIDSSIFTLKDIAVKVSLDELTEKLQTGKKRQDIVATAKETLQRANNCWNPAIIYRWVPIQAIDEEVLLIGTKEASVRFNLGHSSTFVKEAHYALIASYTAGDEIEKEARKASERQQILHSFILDLIGLLVLEKTGKILTNLAEEKAAELGWGVSPFLSPGSVHGWDLTDQLKLCSLLPLERIGVRVRDDAVLEPYKSLTCLIGIGKKYQATEVGSTCQVCSKNADCKLKQA